MSFDPSVNPSASQDRHWLVLLPLTLIGLSLAVFLGAQIGAINQQSSFMKWQLENTDKLIESLKEAQDQLTKNAGQLETQVKQSTEVQNQYQALLQDVLELSKEDEDARKVVEKWKIQRNQAPAAPAGAAAGDAPAGN